MTYLLIVSLIWAFSFGLIKGNLAGLDSNFVAMARLAVSFIVFAPFLNLRGLNRLLSVRLMSLGAIQYGIMYITYIYSFQFLKAYEVALFTIFTPLYVTLINDLMIKKFNKFFLLTALLAIAGTGIIVFQDISQSQLIKGFAIVQISNLSFAFGQVFYKKFMKANWQIKDHQIFGLLYFGALVLTIIPAMITTDWKNLILEPSQIYTLLYLGVIASGICFFLWNVGATKTNTGALAIFNNFKIPLAISVSLIFFHEEADIIKLIIGGMIVLSALFINEHFKRVINTE